MNRIYSSLELALSNIEKYVLTKEQDIYLCKTLYPSGVEYSFRIKQDIPFENSKSVIRVFQLPVLWHLFKKKGNALKAKKKFEAENNCKLELNRTRLDSGDYVYTLKNVQ